MNADKLIAILKAGEVIAYNYRSSRISYHAKQGIAEHIEEIKWAIKHLEELPVASNSREAHNSNVSDRDELRETMCHLSHDLRDVRVELARVAERLRSISGAATKTDLDNTETNVTMKISELQGSLQEVKTNSLKAFSEIRSRIDALDTKITELSAELADAPVPADAQATLADLKTISKQLDDITPDSTELPPPVIPPTEPAARR